MRFRLSSNDVLCANWLAACAALMVVMMPLETLARHGGAGFGEGWRAPGGFIFPLDRDAWMDAFSAYQQSAGFRLENAALTLADFKTLYLWDCLYALWQRLFGLALVLPLAAFAVAGRLARGMEARFVALASLASAQAALAWLDPGAVESSPLLAAVVPLARLGAGTAFFALALWSALTLLRRDGALVMRPLRSTPSLRAHGLTGLAVFAALLACGVLVAGLDPGALAPPWPPLAHESTRGAAFEWTTAWNDPLLVQNVWRCLLAGALALGLSFAWRVGDVRLGVCAVAHAALAALALQTHLAPLPHALGDAAGLLTLWAWLAQLHRALYGAGAAAGPYPETV